METRLEESNTRTTISSYITKQYTVIEQHRAMHTYYVNLLRRSLQHNSDRAELVSKVMQRIKMNAEALQAARRFYHQALSMNELRTRGFNRIQQARHDQFLEQEAKILNLGPEQIKQLLIVTNRARDRSAITQSNIRDANSQFNDGLGENADLVNEQLSHSAADFNEFLEKFGDVNQQNDTGADSLLESVNNLVNMVDTKAKSEAILKMLGSLDAPPLDVTSVSPSVPSQQLPSLPSAHSMEAMDSHLDTLMKRLELK